MSDGDPSETWPDPDVGDTSEDAKEDFERIVDRLGHNGANATHDDVVIDLDVLLVAVVPVEWQALKRVFPSARPARYASGQRWDWGLQAAWIQVPGTGLRYRIGMIRGYGSGALRTLPAILGAIEGLRPALTIMCGIAAGSPRSPVALGDLVVADEIISVEAGRRGDHKWDSRPVPVNREMVLRIQDLVDERGAIGHQVHVGGVIAQHDLLRDRAQRDALVDRFPQAIALEMEGGALTLAADVASSAHTKPMLFKAIVDWADGEKSDTHHIAGAMAAARLAREFIESGPIEGSVPRSHDVPVSDENELRGSDYILDEAILLRLSNSFLRNESFNRIVSSLQEHRLIALSAPSARIGRICGLVAGASVSRIVVEVDSEVVDVISTAPRADATYVLAHSIPLDVGLRLGRRLTKSGAFVVVCTEDSGAAAAVGALAVDWEFYDRREVQSATLLHVRELGGALAEEWLTGKLSNSEISEVIAGATTVEEIQRNASVCDAAARGDWAEAGLVAALGSKALETLRTRIEHLEGEHLAWFLAAGTLQGMPRTFIEAAALQLERMISTGKSPEDGEPSLFRGTSSTIGAVGGEIVPAMDGTETVFVAGVEPKFLMTCWWRDFAAARHAMLEWTEWLILADAGSSHDCAWILASLLELSLDDGIQVTESAIIAARLSSRPLAVLNRVSDGLAAAMFEPNGRRLITKHLDRITRAADPDVRLSGLYLLSGSFGYEQPVMAVEVILRRLRSPIAPADERACIRGLAGLLLHGSSSGEVHQRLTNWLGADWVKFRDADRARKQALCRQVALICERALIAPESLNADVIARLADLLGRLATISESSESLKSLLRSLGSRSRTRDLIAGDVFRYLAKNGVDRRATILGQQGLRAMRTREDIL